MKTTFLMILILLTSFAVSAQKKMTDVEFERYKGKVKSVSIETEPMLKADGETPKNERIVLGVKYFKKDGGLTEETNPSSNYKVVYKLIDGFKTYKLIEIKPKDGDRGTFLVSTIGQNTPLEDEEKLTPPDPRFDFKFVYEYDSKGRIVTEKQYLTNGRLIQHKTLKYDETDRLIEETSNNFAAVSKNTYTYDDKGNLTEHNENSNPKKRSTVSEIVSKTVYSDYVIDKKGNWTKRKSQKFYEIDGKPQEYITTDYRIIKYY